MKLYLDPGHGGQDPGAQGHGLDEKDLTLAIALKIRSILQNDYENIDVKMSRSSDTTKSLGQRSSEANAWGADFFLAIHINSGPSSAQGYEDYIYNGLSNSSKAAQYQDIIHAEVIKVNQLQDRGQKKANFHVLRETNMPALLTENGFISNDHDAALMKQSSWIQKVAQGHVNGIAKAFGLIRKPVDPPDDGTLFKVIAGSFKSKENADERVDQLKSKGIESFVDTTKISGVTWYRVQAGAFSSRDNAEDRLTEVKKAGINDAFLVAE
ncbi:N-acetylmuramoyl-L-alanine amidase [Neobacillus sp. SuZ13]|uniref:N-acetylmuramoyl-L-alanine amidase n=1 Tax=Neobacillus sp. SuZ13 TaxID=3047875 RepID=UPI0024BFF50E|nr:N-acetylmuramoyl-L-alanine amidase [Neobacillus sp. SuZ13]WHY66438.1 N-acetylmuramoyl-L-alanine amidase [Neobacillus sp. SuZ13]